MFIIQLHLTHTHTHTHTKHMGGVRGNISNWMRDYLIEREMRTVIRDTTSISSTIAGGIPQGSVLVSIIFQKYINDIQKKPEIISICLLMKSNS